MSNDKFLVIINDDDSLKYLIDTKFFIKRLKTFCRSVPEFTCKPIFHCQDNLLCYSNEHYFNHDDSVGKFSVRIKNSYFKFNGSIDKFEFIEIDCESFGISRATYNKIHKAAGVPEGYVSEAEQQRANEAEQQRINEAERQQRIIGIKARFAKLKTNIKLLEAELR